MGAAALSFLRARSTIVPHEQPAKLITGGLYRLSRNPIYLADLLLLGGLALVWGSVAGLVFGAGSGPDSDPALHRTRRSALARGFRP